MLSLSKKTRTTKSIRERDVFLRAALMKATAEGTAILREEKSCLMADGQVFLDVPPRLGCPFGTGMRERGRVSP